MAFHDLVIDQGVMRWVIFRVQLVVIFVVLILQGFQPQPDVLQISVE